MRLSRLPALTLTVLLPCTSLAAPRFTVPVFFPYDAAVATPIHATAVPSAAAIGAIIPTLNATSWVSPVTNLIPPVPLAPPPSLVPQKIRPRGTGTETDAADIQSGLLTTTIWSDGRAYTVTQFSEVGPASSIGLTTSMVSGHALTTVPATAAESGSKTTVSGGATASTSTSGTSSVSS
ncbi:hypothetical protein GGR53DRAFT_528353 [Hypoxylon sp. FL1150]|nr:hypothetical protein GGR53DRAFT_528353 [Hypoxylon sp. FL1150]